MGDSEREEGECGPSMTRRSTTGFVELESLDCPICFSQLRPPIYQCTVGHAICSSCRAKLPDKCCVCSRSHNLDNVAECTKVLCCYNSFGCQEKITYFDSENHEEMCTHAPCFCPETGCKFTGSTIMMLNHFTSEHKWHLDRISYSKAYQICIAQGFTILQGEDGKLFLVNMVLEPLYGLISVFLIHPHITESNFKCKMAVSNPEKSYTQVTQFNTKSTTLFDGLPKDSYLFFVPKMLLRVTGTNVTVTVNVTIIPP